MDRPCREYAFRLAERLGMTVAELLDRIDSHELSEWMAYDQINVSESWNQTAQLSYILAAVHSKRPPKFASFLPRRRKRRQGTDALAKGLGMLRDISVPARPKGK